MTDVPAGRAARAVVLAIAATTMLAATAAAQSDPLSGTFRPPGAPDASMDVQVSAEGRGWLARFRGEGLALLPVPPADVATLFPQAAADASLRCAVSPAFMLCSATPGARIQSDYRSATGVFTAIPGGTYQDLDRVR